MTIGIYHIFEANRKALSMSLDGGFNYELIDDWKKVQTATSSIVLIFAPDFLPPDLTADEFRHFLEKIDKTLIIVTYDIDVWTMDRDTVFYLNQPDEHSTIDKIRRLLIEQTKPNNTNELFTVNSG